MTVGNQEQVGLEVAVECRDSVLRTVVSWRLLHELELATANAHLPSTKECWKEWMLQTACIRAKNLPGSECEKGLLPHAEIFWFQKIM